MDDRSPDHPPEHVHDIVQRENPGNAVVAPDLSSRNWTGWIALLLLFGFTFYVALASSLTKSPADVTSYAQGEQVLKRAIEAKTPKERAAARKDLDATVRSLESKPDISRPWARLTIAVEFEAGKPLDPHAKAILARSVDPLDQRLLALYVDPIDPATLPRVLDELPSNPYVYRAARTHAYRRAGVKLPETKANGSVKSLGGLLILGIFGMGLLLWLSIFNAVREGRLRPLGLKLGLITPLQADLLALRAAACLVVSEVVAILASSSQDHIGRGLIALLTIPAVLTFWRLPTGDWRLTTAEFGLSIDDLKNKVIVGLFGFLLEYPIGMIALLIGSVVSRWLPKSDHPLSQVVTTDHSFGTIFAALVSASIIAPFVEETIFRGCLFPAVTRLLRSPVWGAVLTSFVFAALHPQGIASWGGLAVVGAMSCALAYWTRSLIPSIVMHACHNTVTLILVLASSSS